MIFLRIKGCKADAEKALAKRNIAAISLDEIESSAIKGYIVTLALALETKENKEITYNWFNDCRKTTPYPAGTLLHFDFRDAGTDING